MNKKKILIAALLTWILIDGKYINTNQITCVDQTFMGVTTIHFGAGQSGLITISTQKSMSEVMDIILTAEKKERQ